MSTSSPTETQTGTPCTADEVLVEVTQILVDVLGADILLGTAIMMETSFTNDLYLESLQFVLLAEQLRTSYGDEVDFIAWLATMDLDTIIGLRVGQLIDFIVTSVNGARNG